MTVRDVIQVIEALAPRGMQESWDNSGLQVGHPGDEATGVLLCVDVTEGVIAEAVSRGCNLVVSHHPFFFKGLKRLTPDTPQYLALIKAVRQGINIYSAHTSLDNAPGGVSHRMATMLGLRNIRPLSPLTGKMLKLSVMVPDDRALDVRMALFEAGAGAIGQYDMCSYNVQGTGTFRAQDGARPYVGDILEWHQEAETRIDVVLPAWQRNAVERALIEVHPYEEPAYEFIVLDNAYPHAGLGAVGMLPEPMSPEAFVALIKKTFPSPVVRCSTPGAEGATVQKIGLCGGAGGEFIPRAMAQDCDAYLCSDTRYHDFVDYGSDIFLCDIGHWEAELCATQILRDCISKKLPNFAVHISQTQNNPITYL